MHLDRKEEQENVLRKNKINSSHHSRNENATETKDIIERNSIS